VSERPQNKHLKHFGPDNPPPGTGRPKGSKNRSTILRKWADVKSANGTMEDEAAIALIKKATQGDVMAIDKLFDALYGKLTEKSETVVREIPDSRSEMIERFIKRKTK